ncbi:MAG: hypothetical protein V4692_04350, partial [Bdellovibrionota bacterium]
MKMTTKPKMILPRATALVLVAFLLNGCTASSRRSEVAQSGESVETQEREIAEESRPVIATFFPKTRTAVPLVWKGPSAKLERINGTNETFLNIAGVRHRPIFISVNTQGISETDKEGSWKILLDQIDLATETGMPIIDLMMANKTRAFMTELSDRLGSRQVYLWLRFEVWDPAMANLHVPLLRDLKGQEIAGQKDSWSVNRDGQWSKISFYNSLDSRWIEVQKLQLEDYLKNLNESPLARKIIGVRMTYMTGGEWFQAGIAQVDGTIVEDPPGLYSWQNPERFFFGDYSPSEQVLFSHWLKASGFKDIKLPTVADRVHPKLGRSFIVGANGAGQAAYLYHRFLSERASWMQTELSKTAKEITQSKALTMTIQGYLYSLSHFNGALHGAFSYMLNSPYVDAISAPYNYNVDGSRKVGFSLVAHGPMDSPLVHSKLWIHEDDSRPYWGGDGWRTTKDWLTQKALLLRNGVTALIHGNGLYYFDLPNKGWMGGTPEHLAEMRGLYKTLSELKPKLSGKLGQAGAIAPEVAIFVDDDSYHLISAIGMDVPQTYQNANQLVLGMVEKVARLGVPVRYYLLSDIENPKLDVTRLKLAFFLNTPKLNRSVRDAIRVRLM